MHLRGGAPAAAHPDPVASRWVPGRRHAPQREAGIGRWRLGLGVVAYGRHGSTVGSYNEPYAPCSGRLHTLSVTVSSLYRSMSWSSLVNFSSTHLSPEVGASVLSVRPTQGGSWARLPDAETHGCSEC